jgi:hypothetical protein
LTRRVVSDDHKVLATVKVKGALLEDGTGDLAQIGPR